jgi:hypothetical protein
MGGIKKEKGREILTFFRNFFILRVDKREWYDTIGAQTVIRLFRRGGGKLAYPVTPR